MVANTLAQFATGQGGVDGAGWGGGAGAVAVGGEYLRIGLLFSTLASTGKALTKRLQELASISKH